MYVVTALHKPASVPLVISVAHVVMIGATQFTITVNVQVDTLPLISVTVTVTGVEPMLKKLPLAILYVVDSTPQLSAWFVAA